MQFRHLSEIPRQRDLAQNIFLQSLSYNIYNINKYFFNYLYTLLSSRWQNRVHSDDRLCDRPITNERRKDRNNAAPLRSGKAKVNSEKAQKLFLHQSSSVQFGDICACVV
jgi:hypothetical protein